MKKYIWIIGVLVLITCLPVFGQWDKTGGAADDTAYDAVTWDGNTDAPTKNAVRDKIETVTAGATGVDEAYAAGWDSDTAAPEKDDIYDYLHFFDADDDHSFLDETWFTTALSAYLANSVYDAHTVLYATTDNTPAALTVAEQRVVGRVTGGNIAALTLGNAAGNVAQWPADPAAHTLFGFDNTDNIYRPITIGSGLTYTQATATISTTGGGFTITDITGQTDDTTPATTATAVLAQGGSLIESTIAEIIAALVDDTPDDGDTTTPPSENALIDGLALKASITTIPYLVGADIALDATGDTSPPVTAQRKHVVTATAGVVIASLVDSTGDYSEFSNGDRVVLLCQDDEVSFDFTSNTEFGYGGGVDFTCSDTIPTVIEFEFDATNTRFNVIGGLPYGYSDPTTINLGTFTTTETEFIPIEYMKADTTTDPGALTTEDNIIYRNFADDADNDLEFAWKVPTDLTGTTVKVRAIVVVTNATAPADTEGVSWGVAACSSGTNDTHDCSLGTEVNSEDADLDNDAGAQWDLIQFPWVAVTPTNLAAGEVMAVRVVRDTSDADDDYAQDIGLIGIEIAYQRTHATSYSGL